SRSRRTHRRLPHRRRRPRRSQDGPRRGGLRRRPTRRRRGGQRLTNLPPTTTLAALHERLGLPLADETSLSAAMAHRSWCAEHPGHASNERLEFLGDAVLGLVVTDHLYRSYPDLPEGELAKVRASVVSAAALAEVAT